MNILVVNWQDIKNPLAGGAEVHLHEVFSRIASFGHDVTLFCSSFPGAAGEELIDGIRVIRKGGRYLFNYRFLLEYFRRFHRSRFDIVIDDMNKIPFLTPLFVKEPIYGVTHHLFGRSIFLEASFPLAAYVYLMERWAVQLYKSRTIPFVVGSPSTRGELLNQGFPESSVHLVNYGVNHETHAPGREKNPTPLIGYFGRLKRYKCVDHLLEAMPGVLSQVPGVKLVIAGEGDDRPRLESIVRTRRLQSHVEFTGFISEQDKTRLLQRMWCKVTTSSKEGWGLTVIEANACGTPVIASNVEGLRDAVRDGETGLLFDFGNVKDLELKIVRLLQDGSLRDRLATAALAYARQFDWNVAARKTLQLLEERVRSKRDLAAG